MKNSDNQEKIVKFPSDFLWGASTSAYQIEGGITNDWSRWETSEKRLADLKRRGLNYRDFVAGQACGSRHNWAKDIELIKELNLNAYRFGLEWARIEPTEGEFSQEAIEGYRRMLSDLKEAGIKTVVTLWHWTNPVWISAQGGWANKKTPVYYGRYVDYVTRELGGLVDYWLTLNEPTVHVSNGYLNGKFPPNKKNIFTAAAVFNNLTKAHRTAYKIIHAQKPGAKVGFTHLGDNFEPARRWCLPEIVLAGIFNFFANSLMLSRLKDRLDFIGLDYYFHNRVVWYPPFLKNLNKETNDLGWEIYPKGIYNILKQLRRYKKPIIVMENGLADAKDGKREKFIIDHLRFIHQAISEGAPVQGYFHWSLLDNFEWAHGFGAKFGLASFDCDTFERQIRPSGYAYARICRDNGIKI